MPIGETLTLKGAALHHLKNVLRLKPGQKIEALDSDTQRSFVCELTSFANDSVHLLVIEQTTPTLQQRITLMAAAVRPKICDFITEKSTELGISKLHFFSANRTQRDAHATSGMQKRLQRLNRVAEAALKQSGFQVVPQISLHQSLEDVLLSVHSEQSPIVDATNNPWHLIFVAPNNIVTSLKSMSATTLINQGPPISTQLLSNARQLPSSFTNIPSEQPTFAATDVSLEHRVQSADSYVIIGPEGGFTCGEIELAAKYGYLQVTLGSKVLRSETAALIACALVGLLRESKQGL